MKKSPKVHSKTAIRPKKNALTLRLTLFEPQFPGASVRCQIKFHFTSRMCCVKKGTSGRMMNDHVGSLVTLVAYCNGFLSPLVYILRYDVVKRSLAKWMRNTASVLHGKFHSLATATTAEYTR